MTNENQARWLFVAKDFLRLPPAEKLKTDYRVMLEFREGLAGAWTVHRAGEEVIAFGYPRASLNRWFQPFAVSRAKHNAASLALERIIFARRISKLVICDCDIEAVALKGAAVHQPGLAIHSRSNGQTMDAFLEKVFAS